MVYKGMLPDGTIVAVKKSKQLERNQNEAFINDVIIVNLVVNDAPLLVYEFISNRTLSYHIHTQDYESSLSRDRRLRIACEVAGALAYMHFAACIPIFHKDIKPCNILLDYKYSAKVSDFGTSRSVPHDRNHLTTLGYIDPEYFKSSQFTDRSDMYSFRVVLVELITGRRPMPFLEDEGQNLIADFISLMKEDIHLSKILDARVAVEVRKEDIIAIANLAMRCLRLNGKKRPTMKEVSAEVEAFVFYFQHINEEESYEIAAEEFKFIHKSIILMADLK